MTRASVLLALAAVLSGASAWSPLPWSGVLLGAGLVALGLGGWQLRRARRGTHRGRFPYPRGRRGGERR